jgi:hypothetical protein
MINYRYFINIFVIKYDENWQSKNYLVEIIHDTSIVEQNLFACVMVLNELESNSR